MSLTPKQRDLLVYIDDYIKRKQCAPSYDEMTEAMKLASKSGINRLITSLEARGYIRRFEHRARAIEVIRRPGDPPPQPAESETLTTYRAALLKIAAGDGVCGSQAHEYKQIARKALGMAT